MVAGGPVQVGGLTAQIHHGGQAQLVLHGIDLLEGFLVGGVGGQGAGVNAGLFQNVGVVGHADGLGGVGEAQHGARVVGVSLVSVGDPGLIAHIDQQAFPVGKVGFGTVDKDVRQVVCLVVVLQLALDVDAAAHGLDLDGDAGLLLVQLGELFQLLVNFDLAVDQTKGNTVGAGAFTGAGGISAGRDGVSAAGRKRKGHGECQR